MQNVDIKLVNDVQYSGTHKAADCCFCFIVTAKCDVTHYVDEA
jgi:hypothetical protein